MSKFKVGDVVEFVRGGKIGWEEADREEIYGLKIGELYEINGLNENDTIRIGDYWHYPDHFQLAEIEVGDEVEVVNPEFSSLGYGYKQGDKFVVGKIGVMFIYPIYKSFPFYKCELRLIRKGAVMLENAVKLRDKVNALTENSTIKEVDELVAEVYKATGEKYRLWCEGIGNFGAYVIMGHGKCLNYIARERLFRKDEDKYFTYFSFILPSSKLSALKLALTWMLDAEKVEDNDELRKQIAELKSHHEQEGKKIRELEERVK